MRRRQILVEKQKQLELKALVTESHKEKEGDSMKKKTTTSDSNIVSNTAQPALKKKAAMFLPGKIVKPNGTPASKKSK